MGYNRYKELLDKLMKGDYPTFKAILNKYNEKCSKESMKYVDDKFFRDTRHNNTRSTFELKDWNEIADVLQLILDDTKQVAPDNTRSSIYTESEKSFFEKIIKSDKKEKKAEVRFGVFPFQDTILPFFFEYSYNRTLDVKFVMIDDWSKCKDFFDEDKIDVALSDLTTALYATISMNEDFIFCPYFTFYGYSIFARNKSIEEFAISKNLKHKKFIDFPTPQKKEFLEKATILLQKNTDFEWIFRNYCKTINYEGRIEENIEDCTINEGKKRFTDDTYKADIYVTNPIHTLDLKKDAKSYQLIDDGKTLTTHKNFNGLIFKKSYYENNSNKIKELVSTWFSDMLVFDEKCSEINHQDEKEKFNGFIEYLPDFLREINKVNQKIEIKELNRSYAKYNKFYLSAEEAYNSFLSQINESKFLENYKNILTTKVEIKESDFNKAIESLMFSLSN